MKEYDVIVVGAGLAGLTAAAAAAGEGARVLLAAKGAGALTIGGGTIDILGCDADGRPVTDPAAAVAALPESHPYGKLGLPAVRAAADWFLALAAGAGYPYRGSLGENLWLPTAAGTLKPACLAPATMGVARAAAVNSAVILGIAGLKDYRPEMIARGLARRPGYNKHYSVVTVDCGFAGGRDATALDVARWLDSEAGRREFAAQLKKRLPPGQFVIIPPVLGTQPSCAAWETIEAATGCRLLEIAGAPPAVTGLRLRALLLAHLRSRGVAILEHAAVVRAEAGQGRCQAIVTGHHDRERRYRARSFVLATGGFLGGGLESTAGAARESIFGLPLAVPSDPLAWSAPRLLAAGPQPFARFGVDTDRELRPVDAAGRVVLENVRFAGAILAGCDYSHEKAGNGVAVVSGWHAGVAAGRDSREKM
ncbi:anaerobic glycerol-3-phosphate dehydrogenase subunit GlpB [Anaeroselena agilis]|uniref:Anaerobic glycerol-3-phosphate dehydrogenase subunit GlpB n=1 Tax=Anaeroselena agilis TaxID=3063788 RepID=A0ABU3P0A9_9FIRM|nr:anaerobic glycerol-3-phosphate dehydrogenase subunit GlpB [Selenomonadales bacterium 4137-cl]